jgi:hypothetical protein
MIMITAEKNTVIYSIIKTQSICHVNPAFLYLTLCALCATQKRIEEDTGQLSGVPYRLILLKNIVKGFTLSLFVET